MVFLFFEKIYNEKKIWCRKNTQIRFVKTNISFRFYYFQNKGQQIRTHSIKGLGNEYIYKENESKFLLIFIIVRIN